MNENKSSVGSIIGTIIIIAIIILGGLYFWGKQVEESKLKDSLVTGAGDATSSDMSEAATIKTVTPGDDLNSIQSDLQTTNTTGLNGEVNQ